MCMLLLLVYFVMKMIFQYLRSPKIDRVSSKVGFENVIPDKLFELGTLPILKSKVIYNYLIRFM